MMEVFRALSSLRWRWKSASLYQVRVVTGDGSVPSGQSGVVRMNLQLYRTAERFVIDMMQVEGDFFSYVAACHTIVAELRL